MWIQKEGYGKVTDAKRVNLINKLDLITAMGKVKVVDIKHWFHKYVAFSAYP
jgi:hypothetical protein